MKLSCGGRGGGGMRLGLGAVKKLRWIYFALPLPLEIFVCHGITVHTNCFQMSIYNNRAVGVDFFKQSERDNITGAKKLLHQARNTSEKSFKR